MCEFDQRMNIVVISLSAQINKVKRLKYLASTTGASYTCTFNTEKKYILHHIYNILKLSSHVVMCGLTLFLYLPMGFPSLAVSRFKQLPSFLLCQRYATRFLLV